MKAIAGSSKHYKDTSLTELRKAKRRRRKMISTTTTLASLTTSKNMTSTRRWRLGSRLKYSERRGIRYQPWISTLTRRGSRSSWRRRSF